MKCTSEEVLHIIQSLNDGITDLHFATLQMRYFEADNF